MTSKKDAKTLDQSLDGGPTAWLGKVGNLKNLIL